LPAPRLGKPVHWTWGPGRWSVHPRAAPPKVEDRKNQDVTVKRTANTTLPTYINKYQHVPTYINIYLYIYTPYIYIIRIYILYVYIYIYIIYQYISYNNPKTMTNTTHTNIQTSKKMEP
jgi:hypothetical protein